MSRKWREAFEAGSGGQLSLPVLQRMGMKGPGLDLLSEETIKKVRK
jgi:hypothetical protein